jgi:guanylate kinase
LQDRSKGVENMKNKLFVLLSESSGGKDTLLNMIVKNEFLKPVISTTTRKMRSNEEQDREYHFVTKEEFMLMEAKDEFLETTSYLIPSEGIVKYGLAKKDVVLSKSSYVVILNPIGLQQVEEQLGKENVVSIYIHRNDKDRFISYLNREEKEFSLILEDAYERFKKDLNDFAGIETKVDYVINNDGSLEDMMIQFLEILNIESSKQ